MYTIQAKPGGGRSSGGKSSGSKSSSKGSSKSSTSPKTNTKPKTNFKDTNGKVSAPTDARQKLSTGFDNSNETIVKEHTTTYLRDNGITSNPGLYLGAGFLVGRMTDGDKEIPCILEGDKKELEAKELKVPDLPVCQGASAASTGCVWVVGLCFGMGILSIIAQTNLI